MIKKLIGVSLFVFVSTAALAKSPTEESTALLCQSMLQDIGAKVKSPQIGLLEIVLKDGTTQISKVLISVGEEEIRSTLKTLKASRNPIDYVKLHIYEPKTGRYAGRFIELN